MTEKSASSDSIEQTQSDWAIIMEQQKAKIKQSYADDLTERKGYLQRIRSMLIRHEAEWLQALAKDVGKSEVEGYATEIAILLNELDYVERRLKRWTSPRKKTGFKLGVWERYTIHRQPYGSVLIISPWNYPLQLAVMPIIGALAACNRCFLKPSELAPATSQLLAEKFSEYFLPEEVTVVEGDADVTQALLELDWDLIFFTGSPRIGALVNQSAAPRLIPVILELGGKNPCIVDASGFTEQAVERILWGKFINAGQTCIAPDTVFVHESVYGQFVEKAKEQLGRFYGEEPKISRDYGRINQPQHLERLISMLEDGKVAAGGEYDRDNLYMAPTLLTEVTAHGGLMREEIFGPLLPIVPYSDLRALTGQLKEWPDSLTTYLFSYDAATIEHVQQELRCGAFSLNQVITYVANSRIPFGGVGQSGFGQYHGKKSLEAFSYEKPFYRPYFYMNNKKMFPPYDRSMLALIRKLRRWLF